MGVIMKNGISYGGGSGGSGDSAIDLTMAEYEALEAEGKVSPDTTYYITDSSETNNSNNGNSATSTDIDYSQIAFDTSEIVVENASEDVWDSIDELDKKFGMFKISTAEVKLDKTSQTNTYQTNITYDKYCCVGLTFEFGSTIIPSTDGIIGWSLSKEGLLSIVKSTLSYGGENKIYVTAIHD